MQPRNSVVLDPHTTATFQALAEALIPCTPILEVLGTEQVPGAMEKQIDEYIISQLDHFITNYFGLYVSRTILSIPTAHLLDRAATQLIATGKAVQKFIFPHGGPFASLSRHDRFRAITLLEQLQIDLGTLPPPYQNNAGLIKFMTGLLNWMPIFGYYSEWSGYGSTRLQSPNYRGLQSFPLGWLQAGYPGPAFGYRDFRGFMLNPIEKGEN
jgi:hypothetical protein